jgi:hypothetical protein
MKQSIGGMVNAPNQVAWLAIGNGSEGIRP